MPLRVLEYATQRTAMQQLGDKKQNSSSGLRWSCL